VVISHGQGGEALGHHDLATHLARHGFIVASLTHPRDNYRDSTGTGTAEVLFGRPAQVKALVTALLADPKWHALVDADRIGMAGFSDGGYTGLMLLGARPRFERYIGYCERQPQDRDTCGFIERLGAGGGDGMQGFRAHAAKLDADRTRWGETAEPRIRAAFLMAPTSVMFDRDGVEGIEAPVFLYYGTDDRRLLPSEHVLHLAPLLRSPPETRAVADADHWVFLAPCTAELAEAAPTICTDPPGVDRIAVHSRINADAVKFFRRALGVGGR
jgi:predicted dienelactone hydrolase